MTTVVRFKKREKDDGYTLQLINTHEKYTAILDGNEMRELVKQMLPYLNRVELRPLQDLALWCEKHKQFHIMTNNNNLLWFVHKSYSLVGVLMSRKSCKCGHRAREHSYAPGTPFCENTLCFPCMECDCKNYEMAPKEAGF